MVAPPVFREATVTCILILMIPLKIRLKTARTAGAARYASTPPCCLVNAASVLSGKVSSLQFVSSGGLQLLLEIFNSAILEPKDQESWTVVRLPGPPQHLSIHPSCLSQWHHVRLLPSCLQWLLDCLACLLKLICQFAVDPADLDLAYHDVFSWSGLADGQRKRAWQGKSRKSTVEHGKGLHIPRLTEVAVPPPALHAAARGSSSDEWFSPCRCFWAWCRKPT